MSDHLSLAQTVAQCLKKRQETLSLAESCTGGGLANEMTHAPGVSRVFMGSVTSYTNSAKAHVLNIPERLLREKGAVSEEVAILMARNCKDLFASTWALSTTGIAGPSGGSPVKPVGLIFIGIAGPNMSFANRYLFANLSRDAHRKKSIEQALSLLAEIIF